MTAHATLLPLTALLPGVKDDDSRMTWGFGELAAAVRAAEAAHPGALVGTSDYRSAASLAFALDRDDLLAIAQRRSQFDEWVDPGRAGRDVVLVVEDREPMTPWLAGHFTSVRPLGRGRGAPVRGPGQALPALARQPAAPGPAEVGASSNEGRTARTAAARPWNSALSLSPRYGTEVMRPLAGGPTGTGWSFR